MNTRALPESHQAVLTAAYLNARDSSELIAKQAGVRAPTVRRILETYQARGAVMPHLLTNPFRLGLTTFCVYLSLRSGPEKRRKQLIEDLKSMGSVIWVGELAGSIHCGFSLVARSLNHALSSIERVQSRHSATIVRLEVTIITRLTVFRVKYFNTKRGKGGFKTQHVGEPSHPVDEVDQQILGLLAQDPLAPAQQIGRELSIPASTVKYRIRQLEQSGIIQAYMYRIREESFGLQAYLLLIRARGGHELIREALFRYCEGHPLIRLLIECLGPWDFEVGVSVPSSRELVRLMEDLMSLGDGQIDEVTPIIWVEDHKIV